MNALVQHDAVHPPARFVAAQSGIFMDPDKFTHANRVAKVFADSALVPPHFKGKIADCLIALNIADRMQEDPLVVFQNLAIVSGRPCWATQYMIGRANKSGVFRGRITWKAEGEGEQLAVTALATLADTGEIVSVAVSMAMAKLDGWTKNQKYTSMPEHMLRWRSAAMLVRLYAPEVMLGIPTVEEAETTAPQFPTRDVSPATRIQAADAPTEPPRRQIALPAKVTPAGPDAGIAEATANTPESTPADDEVEAALVQFEQDAAAATILGQVDKSRELLDDLQLSRPQQRRVEDASEAARARIWKEAQKAQAASQPDGPPRKASAETQAPQPDPAPVEEPAGDDAEDDATAIDPENPDYQRGMRDHRDGVKRCVISAIKSDPARHEAWQAGWMACANGAA